MESLLNRRTVTLACKNCKFWRPGVVYGTSAPSANGNCHRNPPFFGQVQAYVKWPPIHEDEWCGEFRPKRTGDVVKEAP